MNQKIIKRVAVYCASSHGENDIYLKTGFELGSLLSVYGIEIVYGGSNTGIMGAVANGAISKNGSIIGILPQFLQKQEVAHKNLSQLEYTDNLHERKARMHELADAFIVLPGGLGTLDELFETLTWKQLGLHNKTVILLNIEGVFDDLLNFLTTIELKGFLKINVSKLLIICHSVKECVRYLEGI